FHLMVKRAARRAGRCSALLARCHFDKAKFLLNCITECLTEHLDRLHLIEIESQIRPPALYGSRILCLPLNCYRWNTSALASGQKSNTSPGSPAGSAAWLNPACEPADGCTSFRRAALAFSMSPAAGCACAANLSCRSWCARYRSRGEDSAMPSLDQLRKGQRARIESVTGDGSLVQRLLEMGLIDGEDIEVVAFAPLGDPMEIRLHDYRLSLRRSEAARVLVKVTE